MQPISFRQRNGQKENIAKSKRTSILGTLAIDFGNGFAIRLPKSIAPRIDLSSTRGNASSFSADFASWIVVRYFLCSGFVSLKL